MNFDNALETVLGTAGVLGLLSLFQCAGVWFCRAIYTHVRKKGVKPRQIPGLTVSSLVSLGWTALPIVAAWQIAAWPSLAVQIGITIYLFFAVFTPHGKEHVSKRDAAQEPEQVSSDRRLDRWCRRIGSACFPFLLTGGYVAALRGGRFMGMTAEWLSVLVMVEFLVIHSFPFLALITLPRIGYRRWRAFQWFLFGTWFCLYMALAVADRGGPSAIVAFAAGTIGTYTGFMLRGAAAGRWIPLVKRWAANFIVFIVCAIVSDSSNWHLSPETLRHGLYYFLLVGLLEITGFYDLKLKRVLAMIRKTPAAARS